MDRTVSRSAFKFFHDNAGYVVGRCAIGAIALARAERAAFDLDLAVTWEPDADPDLGDHAMWCSAEARGLCTGHDVQIACLHDAAGDVVGSLGGIIDADRNYRRVIRAELAQEYLDQ